MEDFGAKVLAFLVRIVLSKAFFWTCGLLLLVVGIPLAPRKRIPWLWRIAMVTLAVNCFAWPLIVGFLARYDLEMAWILVFGAAALSFSWSISIALAAGRQPEGLLGWAAAAVEQQMATRRGGGLEIPANATIDQAPLVESPPGLESDPLSGNWHGSSDGLDMTLSLLQRGTTVRGACVLVTNAGKQTWRCTGTLEPNGDLVIQLRAGEETQTFSARLQDPLTMHVRLEGPGFPARDIVLRCESA